MTTTRDFYIALTKLLRAQARGDVDEEDLCEEHLDDLWRQMTLEQSQEARRTMRAISKGEISEEDFCRFWESQKQPVVLNITVGPHTAIYAAQAQTSPVLISRSKYSNMTIPMMVRTADRPNAERIVRATEVTFGPIGKVRSAVASRSTRQDETAHLEVFNG